MSIFKNEWHTATKIGVIRYKQIAQPRESDVYKFDFYFRHGGTYAELFKCDVVYIDVSGIGWITELV